MPVTNLSSEEQEIPKRVAPFGREAARTTLFSGRSQVRRALLRTREGRQSGKYGGLARTGRCARAGY